MVVIFFNNVNNEFISFVNVLIVACFHKRLESMSSIHSYRFSSREELPKRSSHKASSLCASSLPLYNHQACRQQGDGITALLLALSSSTLYGKETLCAVS